MPIVRLDFPTKEKENLVYALGIQRSFLGLRRFEYWLVTVDPVGPPGTRTQRVPGTPGIPETLEMTGEMTSQDIRSTLNLEQDMKNNQINSSQYDLADTANKEVTQYGAMQRSRFATINT